MSRQVVVLPDAAPPKAPYNYAAWAGDTLFLSGQLGLDLEAGTLVSDDVAAQARQAIANLFRVLAAAGLTPAQIVKVNIYLTSMDDFQAVNAVYREALAEPYPARTTVAVAALPFGGKVEIECIACR